MPGTGEIEQHAKIEILPDDILLEIFDCVRLATCQCAARPALKLDCDVCYYLQDYWGPLSTWSRWEWHRLTHVCRRWRSLVLASPYRLDLRLICAFKPKVCFMKKALTSSPTIPIAVWYPKRHYLVTERPLILEDENNAFIALQHPNRIREINLFLTNSLFLKTRAQPFRSLNISCFNLCPRIRRHQPYLWDFWVVLPRDYAIFVLLVLPFLHCRCSYYPLGTLSLFDSNRSRKLDTSLPRCFLLACP